LKQPALGITATILVMAISLLYISFWDFPTFAGWASLVLVSVVPVEVVMGVLWGCKQPPFAAAASQPVRGLLLAGFVGAIGAVYGYIYAQTAGGGFGATPMYTQCMICAVAVTFFACIVWGGWPFTALIKNPIAAGLATLAAAYLVNYILFRIFFNYGFLKGAPVYVASIDPGGMFPGWNALVFYLSALFAMFLFLHFDLWPMSTVPAIMKQPVLGIVWTLVCLVVGGISYYLAVIVSGMDVVRYMVDGPVSFIFGTIVVLNMLQNSVFAGLQQPVKGIANAVTAAVVGTGLRMLYASLMPMVTGNLASGPPPYEAEIWMASALLGVTFPLLVMYADFFGYWPLKRGE
jgi:hypothetical protein